MEHESPIMKALREFALADPEDCDREYEAYLALVNKTDTASVSSPTRTSSVSPPTNSTLPLHNHVHCPAVVSSSSTTRSAAFLHDPSSAMSSTAVSKESASRWDRDDVFPPLAELRRALMTDAEWAAMSEWEKDLWEMKHLPEKERMNSIEGIVMWLPAAQQDQRRKELLEEILRFAEPSPTPDSSTSPASTSDSSIVLSVAAELDIVPLAVHKDTTDLATPTPTTCSTDCLNRAVVSPVSALISSATPISATTNHGAMPEHCCFNLEPAADASMDVATSTTYQRPPAVLPSDAASTLSQWLRFLTPTSALDLLEGGDDFTSMSPSICLNLCLSGGIGAVGSEACSINLVLAPGVSTSGLMPATYLLDDVNISKCRENMFPPWPPPWSVSFQDVIRCKDMIQVLLSDDLILETQLMLRAAKNPCPPPVPNRWTGIQNILQLDFQDIPFMSRTTLLPLHSQSVELIRSRIGMWLCCFSLQSAELLAFCLAACRISNLHGTVDIMQISGDWQSLRTVEIECNPILTVIIFALRVQSVQLQPLVFKWSYLLWFDIHFLSSITLDVLLARRATDFVWTWCCLYNLHGSFGNTNWALEEEIGQMLLAMPWPSFRCHWVAAYPIQLWILRTSHPQEDPYGFAGSFVLHWTSFSDENQTHLLTAAETFCCKLFAIGVTGDCLQYEHLQQWRPPDLVTSVACMGAFCLRFKNCLSDIHWVQLLVIEHWLISWKPGNDSPGHNLVEKFSSLDFTCELLNSVSVDDNLLADLYLLWCMRCVQVDTHGYRNYVSFLQPKPSWSYLAPAISIDVAESLHNIGVSLEFSQFGLSASDVSRLSKGWIIYLPATYIMQCGFEPVPWKIQCSFNFPLYICSCHAVSVRLGTSTILPAGKFSFLLGLHYSCDQFVTEGATYFDSQYFEWQIPWYNSDRKFLKAFTLSAHPPSKAVHLPWDPGDCLASAWSQDNFGRVDDGSSFPLDTSQVPWDPGGLSGDRLGDKPNFKEGGLSATSYTSAGLDEWAITLGPCLHRDVLQIHWDMLTEEAAWNGTDGLGLEGEDRLACACVSCSVASSSSSFPPNLCEFFV